MREAGLGDKRPLGTAISATIAVTTSVGIAVTLSTALTVALIERLSLTANRSDSTTPQSAAAVAVIGRLAPPNHPKNPLPKKQVAHHT